MGFLAENVIPGNYGKRFTTDAKTFDEFNQIQNTLMELEGITDVILEADSNPKVFIIHTDKVITVKDIEDRVKLLNLHAIPTGPFFPLA